MDCLNVYKFLLTKIHKYLNISPKKIVLAEDSAGGNLVLSLMGLILKEKLYIPNGILVAYPVCTFFKKGIYFKDEKLYD